MKLYQSYLSPFPTRVRLLIYAKGLDVEIVRPPGFHGDGESRNGYLRENPIGRIPALELDDGSVLPESEVICEYLEDAFPEPSLRPSDPKGLARVRLLSRISDTYVVMAMVPLFETVSQPPATWDQSNITAALEKIDQALAMLEHYIGEKGYAFGGSLTQADGALIPILLLVAEWLPIFRAPDLLPNHRKVHSYWQSIAGDPIANRLINETRQALEEQIRQRKSTFSRSGDGS